MSTACWLCCGRAGAEVTHLQRSGARSIAGAVEYGVVSDELERFIKAQNNTFAGFADALREIQTDCKCGHWIWYVFPQLSGLGSSWSAQFYGIDGVDEARAYLTQPIL